MAEDGSDNTVVVGGVRRLIGCLASYRVEPLVFVFTLAVTLLGATSQVRQPGIDPGYMSRKYNSLERINFIRSKLSNFYAHASGVSRIGIWIDGGYTVPRAGCGDIPNALLAWID